MVGNDVLLRVKDLKKYFPIREGFLGRQTRPVKAVDGISFEIKRGETLGLVGESGCGKTTTGRAILHLIEPTSGEVFLEEQRLSSLDAEGLRQLRPKMQMIFQDPYASLNPRHSVGKIIAEPMVIHGVGQGGERAERVAELLELVGMDPGYARRFPHEFSGGQRQRIGIARALSLNPSFIVCDEPVSSLDVSIQAQVVNLMEDLQEQLGLSYLFIAHDLSMVKHISHRIAVMYLGRIVELADRNVLFEDPLHPYTQSLGSAVPIANPRLERERQRFILEGEPPSAVDQPSGCVFHPRCPISIEECTNTSPRLRELRPGHHVACHLADEKGTSKIADEVIPVSAEG